MLSVENLVHADEPQCKFRLLLHRVYPEEI